MCQAQKYYPIKLTIKLHLQKKNGFSVLLLKKLRRFFKSSNDTGKKLKILTGWRGQWPFPSVVRFSEFFNLSYLNPETALKKRIWKVGLIFWLEWLETWFLPLSKAHLSGICIIKCRCSGAFYGRFTVAQKAKIYLWKFHSLARACNMGGGDKNCRINRFL